jgi:hypothetical protein
MGSNGRWLSLLAALFAAGGTGVSYAYSVYSGALKARFSLSQSDVDTIGIVSNVLGLISFLGGALADRWGPGLSTGLGGSIAALGYFGQWAITHWYPGLSPSQARAMSRVTVR